MSSRWCDHRLVCEWRVSCGVVSIVPNTYHHPQRDIDTVMHGDDFVAVAEDGQ